MVGQSDLLPAAVRAVAAARALREQSAARGFAAGEFTDCRKCLSDGELIFQLLAGFGIKPGERAFQVVPEAAGSFAGVTELFTQRIELGFNDAEFFAIWRFL